MVSVSSTFLFRKNDKIFVTVVVFYISVNQSSLTISKSFVRISNTIKLFWLYDLLQSLAHFPTSKLNDWLTMIDWQWLIGNDFWRLGNQHIKYKIYLKYFDMILKLFNCVLKTKFQYSALLKEIDTIKKWPWPSIQNSWSSAKAVCTRIAFGKPQVVGVVHPLRRRNERNRNATKDVHNRRLKEK